MSLVDPEAGYPFTGTLYNITPARLNAKTVLIADANYLAALNTTYAGMCVRCIGTVSAGIFKPNRTYFRNESNTGWIEDTQFRHRHNRDTDEAGGLLRTIQLMNIHDTIDYQAGFFPSAKMFKLTKTGTSDIIDQGDRVDFSVENVTNGYCIGNLQGGLLDIGVQSAFAIYGFATSGSRMTVKIGIGMEHVNLAPTIDRRYGVEACDTSGSARPYNINTGDGTSSSNEPTNEQVQQTAARGLLFLHTPGQNVKMIRFVGGIETISIKTTHIPVTGTVQSNKPFTIGYKTNEAVAKQWKLYSMKIASKPPNTLWPNAFD